MPKFDMVLFDCDGVLVDSEPITNQLMRDDLVAYGLDLPLDEIMRLFVGGTMIGVFERAREMGAPLPDDWVETFYQKMFDTLAKQVTPIPGAADVLTRLQAAGIPFAVGSNGPHEKMRITLARCGLAELLAGRVYSREDVANPKPAPDVYLKAATDAGIAPERCAVIEDSASGAKAGQAAGMTVFGFAADTPAARLEPCCDVVFDRLSDLPELLGL